jgi:para-nitrobenzyl esterase
MAIARRCAVVLFAGALFAALAFAPLRADAASKAGTRVVDTDRGPVRGSASPTLLAFLGIPYAAAPTGDLRWQPPRRHARWSAPIDATTFRSSCPQTGGTALAALEGAVPSVDEDCLFLNVYAPGRSEGVTTRAVP